MRLACRFSNPKLACYFFDRGLLVAFLILDRLVVLQTLEKFTPEANIVALFPRPACGFILSCTTFTSIRVSHMLVRNRSIICLSEMIKMDPNFVDEVPFEISLVLKCYGSFKALLQYAFTLAS